MNQATQTIKPLSQLAPAGTPPRKCVLGLTGNPGAGKSVAAKCFESLGAIVVNADHVGHQLLKTGSPVFNQVVSGFGDEILDEAGEIDRKKLGRIVFGSPDMLEQLNQIVHPHIQRNLVHQVDEFRKSGAEGPMMIDAALIFEWGSQFQFDGIIVIAAPTALRRQRFVESRGFAGKNFDQREAAQLSQDEKIKRADVVFWNTGSIEDLDNQIQAFIQT
ncbi:dephospho-CoA kinase [bacterium]|nr:dephospho-CoA kinase [bacterium]